jgi:hypothetical protein
VDFVTSSSPFEDAAALGESLVYFGLEVVDLRVEMGSSLAAATVQAAELSLQFT